MVYFDSFENFETTHFHIPYSRENKPFLVKTHEVFGHAYFRGMLIFETWIFKISMKCYLIFWLISMHSNILCRGNLTCLFSKQFSKRCHSFESCLFSSHVFFLKRRLLSRDYGILIHIWLFLTARFVVIMVFRMTLLLLFKFSRWWNNDAKLHNVNLKLNVELLQIIHSQS